MKKHRWRAWDLNPGRQDGRSRWIHWAMAAPPLSLLCWSTLMSPFVCLLASFLSLALSFSRSTMFAFLSLSSFVCSFLWVDLLPFLCSFVCFVFLSPLCLSLHVFIFLISVCLFFQSFFGTSILFISSTNSLFVELLCACLSPIVASCASFFLI